MTNFKDKRIRFPFGLQSSDMELLTTERANGESYPKIRTWNYSDTGKDKSSGI